MQIKLKSKKIRLANTWLWLGTIFILVEVQDLDFEYSKEEVKWVETHMNHGKTEAENVKILMEMIDEITHSLLKVTISAPNAEYVFENSHE